jgi:hypothetical protein
MHYTRASEKKGFRKELSVVDSNRNRLLVIISTIVAGFKGAQYRKDCCLLAANAASCIFYPEGSTPFFSMPPTSQ